MPEQESRVKKTLLNARVNLIFYFLTLCLSFFSRKIFLDCPPIEIVADAQIINRYVDRTIFIIRAGLLERVMLPELERIYEDKRYHNMALILNGTPLSRSRYGYSHSYRYGYGYGYGYGYNYGSRSVSGK